MSGIFQIGQFKGVPIKIHWSFSILLIIIAGIIISSELILNEVFFLILGLFSIFFCVLLHEYGHALAAKKLNIKVYDILLTPIGGFARLEEDSKKLSDEILIALAGPLMNLILAVILIGILILIGEKNFISLKGIGDIDDIKDLLYLLFLINSVLFLFNLIPAFPMDGGRILRAILSMKYNRTIASTISNYTSIIIAIGFVVFGIIYKFYIIALIGIVILALAKNENDLTKSKLHFK